MSATKPSKPDELESFLEWIATLPDADASKALHATSNDVIERILDGSFPCPRVQSKTRIKATLRKRVEPFLAWLRALPSAEAMKVHDLLTSERLNRIIRQLPDADNLAALFEKRFTGGKARP